MPGSLKCNEKILGSVTLLNFLYAGLHSDLPLLTIIGPHGKTTLIEISGFFLLPLRQTAMVQHLFMAHTAKTAKNREIRGDFQLFVKNK